MIARPKISLVLTTVETEGKAIKVVFGLRFIASQTALEQYEDWIRLNSPLVRDDIGGWSSLYVDEIKRRDLWEYFNKHIPSSRGLAFWRMVVRRWLIQMF